MDLPVPKSNQVKLYFEYLQAQLTDKRDNRGKRHNLAFVLTGFLLTVLGSGSRLEIASLQRRMVKEHEGWCKLLGAESSKAISDAQLRRVLARVDYQAYNKINEQYFGITLSGQTGVWQAVEGKELKGTIDGLSGEKRGENVVRLVNHEGLQSEIIGFYQGDKEWEKTIVKAYFSRQAQLKKAYSLDALHTYPALLEEISSKQGIYLTQVKANQKELLSECEHVKQHLQGKYEFETVDKAHGRLEKRVATVYELKAEWLDKRWKDTHIASLIVINRERLGLKDQKYSKERAYFISNLALTAHHARRLFEGVRKHWSVETDNYVRDVTLGEDYIRCEDSARSRTMACVINIALNLMRRQDTKANLKAFREDLNFYPHKAFDCFSLS